MNKYIDNDIILQKKIEPLIYIYIMIIIVISLSLIILFILCRYKTYYYVKGTVVSDRDYYVQVYVPLDKLMFFVNNKKVAISGKNYEYEIVNIDSEYFTDNVTTYQIVEIIIDMPEQYKFNNLVLELKFLKEDKRIIDYILRKGDRSV